MVAGIYRRKPHRTRGCSPRERAWFSNDKSLATMVYLLYILPHWSVHHASSIDTVFNLEQLIAMAYHCSNFCLSMYNWTNITALDEKPAVRPSMTANMTTPNQLMELSHPQSHDDASTPNTSLTITVKLAGLSKGVVPAVRTSVQGGL